MDEGHKQQKIIAVSGNRSIDWVGDLSKGLIWLNERAWPLSGCILFTAAMYLNSYIVQEQVPLSITSAAVLTALPTMFAMLLFVIAVTTVFLLIPISILFTKFNDREKRFIDYLSDGDGNREQVIKFRKRILLHWLGGLAVAFLYWLVIAYLPGILGSLLVPKVVYITATIAATVSFIWLVAIGPLPSGLSWRSISSEFWVACIAGTLLQLFLTFYAIVLLGRLAQQLTSANDLALVAGGTLGVIVLWFIQVACMIFMLVLRDHQNPVGFAAASAAAVVMLVGLIGPVASPIAGYAFQVTASGAKSCVVMDWEPSSEVEALKDPQHPGTSQKLKILAEVDGVYFVRPWQASSKEVYFVARSHIRKLDGCSDRHPKAN